MNKKGLLISFEGIDGCGKSTQAKMLIDYLNQNGIKNTLLREPGSDPIAEEIREIILKKHKTEMFASCELLLYEASRAQLVEKQIKPLLENGTTVIMDRFFDSSTAYQGYGRGIDPIAVQTLNKIACQGIKPDLTFYLHLKGPDGGFSRIESSLREKDRIEEAGFEFFEKVIDGYLKIAEDEKDRFIVLNAESTIEHIHDQIKNILKSKLC